MNSIVAAYLGIFTPVLALGLLGGWIACRLWDYCRARKPVPCTPADTGIDALMQAVTCHWCRPQPKGRCVCGVWCGHQRCPRLTRGDLDYCDNGTEMPR